MKKKEQIVAKAVSLFNERGVGKVSIRDIAGELSMSSGNFAYHFKNKEALIEYFYARMYDEVEIETQLRDEEGFSAFNEILRQITEFMNRYSFFYTDIVDIFRSCPGIQNNYANNYEGRKSIYKGILKHFIDRSLIVLPANEDSTLDEVTHTIWFTLTFWQSQKKILPANSVQVQPSYVIKQIWRILMPYMTDVGLAEYDQLIR